MPSANLLDQFPRLKELYTPFIRAIKAGDMKRYDDALLWAERRLVDEKVYLCVEKARDVCMRSFMRKV